MDIIIHLKWRMLYKHDLLCYYITPILLVGDETGAFMVVLVIKLTKNFYTNICLGILVLLKGKVIFIFRFLVTLKLASVKPFHQHWGI